MAKLSLLTSRPHINHIKKLKRPIKVQIGMLDMGAGETPSVLDISGVKADVAIWLTTIINQAIAFRMEQNGSFSFSIRWELTGLPSSVTRKIVSIQKIPVD